MSLSPKPKKDAKQNGSTTDASFLFLAKWGSLICLVGQSLAFAVCFRYARLLPSTTVKFSNLTAVCTSEAVKLIASVVLVLNDSGKNGLLQSAGDRRSFLLMGVPGLMYALQNYLYFVGISNLSISLYQVTKQLQILTTALMSVIVLSKKVSIQQWLCLLFLTCGVILISSRGDNASKGVFFVGVSSVLCATWLSAGAGVYTEYMLKKGAHSLWERNVQLATFGILFALIAVVADSNEREKIAAHGFFAGYNMYTWGVVFLQSLGGMITSAVMKYADNIMKVVVKSLAVALSVVLSRLCFNEGPDLREVTFQIGLVSIISSSAFYTLGHEWLLRICRCAETRKDEATRMADDERRLSTKQDKVSDIDSDAECPAETNKDNHKFASPRAFEMGRKSSDVEVRMEELAACMHGTQPQATSKKWTP